MHTLIPILLAGISLGRAPGVPAAAAPTTPLAPVAAVHLLERRDPADSLYDAAREALNRGDYRRAAELFARVADRYPESAHAADAFYWRAFALYRTGGTRNLREALDVLRRQKESYPKAATRGDAEELQVRIEGALAKSGDAGAGEKVVRRGDQAAQAGCPSGDGDDDDDMRVAALNALLQMDADRAMPILQKVLARRDACSAPLRRKAVFLVAQKRNAETESLLLDVARTDPDREVRKQAIFWLGQVNSDRAIAALDSVLQRADDPELRDQAVFAISQQRGDRAGAILRRVAEDSAQSSDVREKAVFWLGQQRSPANAQFLRGLFDRTTSEELRGKVMFSLSQMQGVGNDQWLLDVASSPKYGIDVRKQALFSAGQARGPIEQLLALYDKLTERELKEQLIFVIADRREPAAVDKLIAIAKSDKDPEMRKKAIFWLGQSRDPRVQQLLLDIING